MANRQCSSTLVTKQIWLPTAVPLSANLPSISTWLYYVFEVFEVVFRIWRVSLNFLAKKKIISFENIVL